MQVLLDSSKKDSTAHRYFIQYEVLQKKPIFESYKTFHQTLGDDTMDYQEFEFWYWRFYNGGVDVHYDRSTDRKPLELLQMPLEMIGKIVQTLDLADRMKIRYVSKTMRAIADNKKLKMRTISLYKTHDSLHLTINENRFTYCKTRLGFSIQRFGSKKADVSVENENYVTYALNNLRATMKNSKLELESFRIEEQEEAYKSSQFLRKTLKILSKISDSSDFKFHVKEICVRSNKPEHVVSLLSLLKPGILKKITLGSSEFDREGFDAITRTRQWNETKVADIQIFRGLDPSEIEKCAHFEEFKISVNSISSTIVVQLKEILLQSNSFKKCRVCMTFEPVFTINDIAAALGLPIQKEAVRVPIPGTDECLVFRVGLNHMWIMIERKNCLPMTE